MKSNKNNRCWLVRLGNIRASSRPMAVFSSFYESSGPPPSVDARGCCTRYSTAALRWPSKWLSKWVHITLLLLFCLLLPWRLPKWYRASSRPMVASSGFQCGPGHAALGNAACTASTPPHGHRNGQRQRCILLLLPPFSLGVIIAKDHVMVH